MQEKSKDIIDQELEVFDSELLPLLNQEYNYPVKVDFSRNNFSIFEIKRIIDSKEIILDPDFQRKSNIWKLPQKSKLIESILMGIPIPLFYFAENKNGGLSVVDGLQRLFAIKDFMDDKYELKDLFYLQKINGLKFSQLERDDQQRIERYQLQVNVMSSNTPEYIKLNIFQRINSGSTPLNKQEMRHALYQGKSTKLLQELSACDEFNKAVATKLNTVRMKDRYIILRALAFYLWKNNENIKSINTRIKTDLYNDFDDFLGRYMRIINSMTDEYINELKNIFKESMILLHTIYKKQTFRRSEEKPVFNMVLFESLFFITAALLNKINIDNNTWKKELDNIINQEWFQIRLDESFKGTKQMITHYDTLKNIVEKLKEKYA
ncbi:MAG: DUF262 domain-containing protein [Mucispirillum sp.]|nr:DUF262 domain-containing protein [Mucispirillum sp.]